MSERNKCVCPVEIAGGLDTRLRRWIQNPKRILLTFALRYDCCIISVAGYSWKSSTAVCVKKMLDLLDGFDGIGFHPPEGGVYGLYIFEYIYIGVKSR